MSSALASLGHESKLALERKLQVPDLGLGPETPDLRTGTTTSSTRCTTPWTTRVPAQIGSLGIWAASRPVHQICHVLVKDQSRLFNLRFLLTPVPAELCSPQVLHFSGGVKPWDFFFDSADRSFEEFCRPSDRVGQCGLCGAHRHGIHPRGPQRF